MKKLLPFLFLFSIALLVYQPSCVKAQGVGVNSSGNPADPSAMFDVSSHSRGVLISRMTESERNAITSPALGLQIFNTTTNCLNLWVGNTWKQICGDCDFNSPVASSNSPICQGTTLNLAATSIPGATYLWSGPNGFTSTVQNPSILNTDVSASGVYSVTATKDGCSAPAQSIIVSVNSAAATPIAGNDGPKCVGEIFNLTASTIVGATYSWTGPNGYSAVGQNQIITSAQLSHAGNYNVIATVNGCASAPGTTAVTIYAIPATPGSISGPAAACANSTGNVYSIAAVSGATSYNWTVPSGATITANTGTSVTVSYGAAPSGSITVSATNTCGTSGLSSLSISTTTICSPMIFNNTGAQQTFTVPSGVSAITLDVRGAAGFDDPWSGGNGGQAIGTLAVSSGQTIYIYVGRTPVTNNLSGWNGGGTGFYGGGDASDIRIGGTSLADRIIVAGGGGGMGFNGSGYYVNGGAGGGDIGGTGTNSPNGTGGAGGTQVAGGAGGTGPVNGQAGSLGQGGNAPLGCRSGGGGGGYYGGGAGGDTGGVGNGGGGGGGSNYLSPSLTNTQSNQGVQNGDGQVIITW